MEWLELIITNLVALRFSGVFFCGEDFEVNDEEELVHDERS